MATMEAELVAAVALSKTLPSQAGSQVSEPGFCAREEAPPSLLGGSTHSHQQGEGAEDRCGHIFCCLAQDLVPNLPGSLCVHRQRRAHAWDGGGGTHYGINSNSRCTKVIPSPSWGDPFILT